MSEARLINWAGNHRYGARRLVRPRSLAELRGVLGGGGTARVLATRHSFTAMGDADTLISLAELADAGGIELDREAMTVTVGADVTFAQLAVELNRHGLALENLASLPHISVGGALATATHGSGDHHGNLSTLACAMTLMTGDGDLLRLSAADARWPGLAVHLGLLGVVVSLTLRVIPYYEVRQIVYDGLGWEALFEHWDAVFSLGRSVSVFHRLGPRTQAVWVKADAAEPLPDAVFDAGAAPSPRHPIVGEDARAATAQLGAPGPWSERLPHFRSGVVPSAGREIQSEVFVSRRSAPAALAALRERADELTGALLVGEVRTVAADELWLSPQYRRDSVGLHFTWRRAPEVVARHVARIESLLAPFAPRPHWGKVLASPVDRLADAYEQAPAFAALRAELDPRGTFANAWARRHVPFLLGTGSAPRRRRPTR